MRFYISFRALFKQLCINLTDLLLSKVHRCEGNSHVSQKTRPKSVRWCARLTWLILLIWWFWMICFIKLNYKESDSMRNITRILSKSKILHRSTICHGWGFPEILHPCHNIHWLKISWDIITEAQYLMDADLVRYYTKTTISHGCRFFEMLEPQYFMECKFH